MRVRQTKRASAKRISKINPPGIGQHLSKELVVLLLISSVFMSWVYAEGLKPVAVESWYAPNVAQARAYDARWSPDRCEELLFDAGRKYSTFIWPYEYRACQGYVAGRCNVADRHGHYDSKVARKCNDATVKGLADDPYILDWPKCQQLVPGIQPTQAGLQQCFYAFFEPKTNAIVDAIYQSSETSACKDDLFKEAMLLANHIGDALNQCHHANINNAPFDCMNDKQFAAQYNRMVNQQYSVPSCKDKALVSSIRDKALDLARDSLTFVDNTFTF